MRTMLIKKNIEIVIAHSLEVPENPEKRLVFNMGGTVNHRRMKPWGLVITERKTEELFRYRRILFKVPKRTTSPQKPMVA